MKKPTHEEISQQAYQLWRDQGCPAGRDAEIWLEAEQKLTEDASADTAAPSDTATKGEDENHPSPAQAEHKQLQKQEARAPQEPQHSAPKKRPAETGKPLWPQTRSS